MISVVIPLFNKAITVERAIRSVLGQSHLPQEIIVVDDGSTDESLAHIPQHPLIRVVSQTNQGVSAARNKGISEAQNEYVAFLDADDEWKPDFLSRMWHLKEIYPDCTVFASSYEQHDAAGQIRATRLNGLPFLGNEGHLSNYFEVATHSDPPICSISLMVKRSALQAIGGFPVGIAQGEDLLTWARLAVTNRIAYCRESLAIFHNEQSHSTEAPKRVPPIDDIVGEELKKLYHSNPSFPGLKAYVAHWHKMRASIYLRLPHQSKACRHEVHLSLAWHRNKKLYAYYLLSLLPFQMRLPIIQKLS